MPLNSLSSPLPAFHSAYRFSGRLLLAALLALFILPPFLEPVGWDQVADCVLFTAVMLSALLAVSDHRVRPRDLLLLLPPIAMLWLQRFGLVQHGGVAAVYFLYMIVLVAFTVWRLLRFVLGVKEVDAEALAAGVSIYLLIGLLWSFLYVSLGLVQASPFKGELSNGAGRGLTLPDAFYFSLCTLTTAGYGDIAPLSHQARTLAIMESVTGVLYVGVLIARLVSLYSQAKPPAPSERT
jgi:hypothetical protein